MRDVLALPAARRPTALFAANNRITVGAVRALRGLADADAPALVGFDDFELADMLATPVTASASRPPRWACSPPRRPTPAWPATRGSRGARSSRASSWSADPGSGLRDDESSPAATQRRPAVLPRRPGERRAARRPAPPPGDHVPEDWVGSTPRRWSARAAAPRATAARCPAWPTRSSPPGG
ncbi:hypothetical protein [Baekduia alba]|uniref:hypothetical protein n=1 Tax=Baekduia alba TaxID=2997333 RepID=UPI002342278E|nr:hypothetical protein [Baekduia alba]